VAKAVAVHGVGRYDYSQTVYLPMPQKIAIRCPEHGVYMQKAGQHLVGKGCPNCGAVVQRAKARERGLANQKWTTETFRARCKELHPKLSFERAIYSPERGHKVHYDCPLHGPRTADQHSVLAGRGCGPCRYDKNRGTARFKYSGPRKTRQLWVDECNFAHSNKYDYSKLPSSFLSIDKVIVICSKHGEFSVGAGAHKKGRACLACRHVATSERHSINRDGYLSMFRATHGERYDYSQVQSQFKAKDKVPIICEEHGIFQQAAFEHAHGQGCPKCGRVLNGKNSAGWSRTSWIEAAKGRPALLYVIRLRAEAECFYKIGITFRSVKERFSSGLPYEYEEVKTVIMPNAGFIYDLEKHLKTTLKPVRYEPAKPFCGRNECFTELDPILAALPL
jgi:hypothetical protein